MICKPGIEICNQVVQNCPYYSPARYQNYKDCNKRQVIFGGLPAFMCPDASKKSSAVRDKILGRKNSGKFYPICQNFIVQLKN